MKPTEEPSPQAIACASMSPPSRLCAISLHHLLKFVSPGPRGKSSPFSRKLSERTSPSESRHIRMSLSEGPSLHPGSVRRTNELLSMGEETLLHKRFHHAIAAASPKATTFY